MSFIYFISSLHICVSRSARAEVGGASRTAVLAPTRGNTGTSHELNSQQQYEIRYAHIHAHKRNGHGLHFPPESHRRTPPPAPSPAYRRGGGAAALHTPFHHRTITFVFFLVKARQRSATFMNHRCNERLHFITVFNYSPKAQRQIVDVASLLCGGTYAPHFRSFTFVPFGSCESKWRW